MADFTALKTAIQNAIKQNGNNAITGNLLQDILISMVSTLGDSAINGLVSSLSTETTNRQNADGTLQSAINTINTKLPDGYTYLGIATSTTNPSTTSGKVFYIATTAGTYTNFHNSSSQPLVLTQGINILKYNGTSWSLEQLWSVDDVPTAGSNNLVKSGGVLDSIIKDGSAFDLSAYNSGATYADLSAALTALNVLPAAYKKGGMSMKFVQTSDNNYVQFRCIADEFTTDTTQWVIAEEGVYVENPEFIYVKTDSEGKILWAIKTDGGIYYGAGVPRQVIDYINEKIADLSLDEYEDIVAFLNGLEEGDKTLQTLLDEKVDKEEGKSLINAEFAEGVSQIESPEFAEVHTDADDKVLYGVKQDGDFYFGAGVPSQIKEKIDSNIEAIKTDVANKVDKIPGKGLSANDYTDDDKDIVETQKIIENPEYIEAKTDSEGKLLAGRIPDGAAFENIGFSTPKMSIDGHTIENIEDLEERSEVTTDSKNKIVSHRGKDGMLHEHVGIETNHLKSNNFETNSIVVNNDAYFENGVPRQILNEIPGKTEDIIPYNDYLSIGYRTQKIYNPYKELHSHQFTGQIHCHTWTYATYQGVMYKVPYGYTVEEVAAMTDEELAAAQAEVDVEFAQRHKNEGYDFMTISNYWNFMDVTPKPTPFPDNFLWLCNSYEDNMGEAGIDGDIITGGCHMIVLGAKTVSHFWKGIRQVAIENHEDNGCIVNYPHPFYGSNYTSPQSILQITKRLRFIEVYNGITVFSDLKPDVMLDECFDALLSSGHFTFATAVSDARPTLSIKVGCIKVFANSLKADDIFESLLCGNFYAASTSDASINGVLIENGKYEIDIGKSDVIVEFIGENNTVLSTVTTTNENTLASYSILGTEMFVRARIYKLNSIPYDPTAWHKNKEWIIWTQPVFISKNIL